MLRKKRRKKKASSWCTTCHEAFCETCCSYHKSFKVSKQHRMMDISALGDQTLRTAADISCPQHKTEPVKIYCKDHKTPCCHMCATLNHRKCEDVVSIEEAAKEFCGSKEVQQLIKSLSTKSESWAELLEKRSNNVKAFQEKVKQTEKKITSYRANLNSHLDTLEKKAREDVAVAEKNFTCNTEITETEITALKSALGNCKAVLETSIEHGSEVQCLIQYNKVKEQHEKFEKLVQEKCRSFRVFNVSFKLDEDVQNIQNISSFGDINVLECPVRISSSLVSPKLAQEGIIVSKHKYSSTSRRSVAGVFASNKIVLVEYNSCQVTILDLNASVLDSMKLNGEPYDVTLVGSVSEVVAVSLSNKRSISVISLKPLSVVRNIDTNVACYGIDFHSEIIAFASGRSAVSFLSFKSEKEICSVKSNLTWFGKLINKKDCIYAQNGNSVVSSNGEKTEKLCEFSELKEGRGIECDMYGNIYVVGMTSYNIIQISTEGRITRVISTSSLGLKGRPWSIAFRPDSLEFLITSLSGEAIFCNITSADDK